MKKCPSCYAIMIDTITPAQVPKLQLKPSEGRPEFSSTRVRYECTQCGHTKEEFRKPAPAQRYP